MRKIIISTFLLSILWAQFKTPVELSAFIEDQARPGEVSSVAIKATMDQEWYMGRANISYG